MTTILRSLPSATLRVSFLRAYLGDASRPEAARTFDQMCHAGARGGDKEALFAVALLLSSLAVDPVLDRLGEHAARQRLEDLGRLLRRGSVASHPPPSKVPEYRADRELTIGERRSMARRPNRQLFEKLLADPNPLVIERLLENPRLTEDDVVRFSARRPAPVEALLVLARTAWLCRRRVRLTLLQNPGTPAAVTVPLVALCTRAELGMLSKSFESIAIVRQVARELLAIRDGDDPPSQPSSSSSSS
jgi:hypothetical protein